MEPSRNAARLITDKPHATPHQPADPFAKCTLIQTKQECCPFLCRIHGSCLPDCCRACCCTHLHWTLWCSHTDCDQISHCPPEIIRHHQNTLLLIQRWLRLQIWTDGCCWLLAPMLWKRIACGLTTAERALGWNPAESLMIVDMLLNEAPLDALLSK